MSEKTTITLYTAQRLSDPEVTGRLWPFLTHPLVRATRFDSVEPAKKKLDAKSFDKAAALFLKYRMLIIEGGNDGFGAMMSDYQRRLGVWNLWLDASALQGPRATEWMQWLRELCAALPILFGSVCLTAEWNAKHETVKVQDGIRITGAVGIAYHEFFRYLPGVYWLTLFGPDLTAAFGLRERALPGTQSFVIDDEQRGILLDEPIDAPALPQRLKRENEIAAALGSQYFFDRADTTQVREQVPALASKLASLEGR